jgi:hypothetical protein
VLLEEAEALLLQVLGSRKATLLQEKHLHERIWLLMQECVHFSQRDLGEEHLDTRSSIEVFEEWEADAEDGEQNETDRSSQCLLALCSTSCEVRLHISLRRLYPNESHKEKKDKWNFLDAIRIEVQHDD